MNYEIASLEGRPDFVSPHGGSMEGTQAGASLAHA